jgi:L-iditol 2-dehydrogenase
MTDSIQMKALVKNGKEVLLAHLPIPRISEADQVLIKVSIAGICRTDLYVAQGLLPAADGLVLGHEFSGTIVETGSAVSNLDVGDRVAVMPIIPCGECVECIARQYQVCQKKQMLGLDIAGAFAEYVIVPASVVVPIPDSMPFGQAAYAEPVAASLAVLRAGIRREQRGLIYGENRISTLTERVLNAHGFEYVVKCTPDCIERLPQSSFDFAVETSAEPDALDRLMKVVRPLGKIIIKSRHNFPATFNMMQAIQKELVIQAVNYSPISQAIEILDSEQIKVDDLMGRTFSLDEHADAFAACLADERSKFFFAP